MPRPRILRGQPPPPAGPPLDPREAFWLIAGVILLEIAAISLGTDARLSEWSDRLVANGWSRTLAGAADPAQARRLLGLAYTAACRLLQLACLLVVWRLFLRRTWEDLGVRPSQFRWDAKWMLVTCGAFGVLALLGELAGFASGGGDAFRQYLLPDGRPNPGLRIPAYALWHFGVYCLVAPVAEEVFFRAVIYRRLAELTSVRIAIPASAFIFALAHFAANPFPVVEFIGGLAFAGLFARTRSLLPAIGVHAAGNAAILAVHYLYL